MIISLVNQKGGVGKTTVSINLADAITEKGHKTLLIDADPQGSVLQWQSISDQPSFDVIHHPKATFHKNIKSLSKGYKHVVIDAPPGQGQITLSILLASNMTIIPIGPSPLDIWSSTETVTLINKAKKHNRKLRGGLLVSRKVVGTVPARDARATLERYKKSIFKTEIGLRIDFVKSMINGQSVLRYAPNREAAKEIRSLCNEVIKRG